MGERVLRALVVVCEMTGRQVSPDTLDVWDRDLGQYPESWVLGALNRCRRECARPVTLADILARLDDGRPGAEEAWAMIPRDESASICWSGEMAIAWGVARPLMDEGDQVAARMAFREAYAREVEQARAAGREASWSVSLGTDPAHRERVILEAVDAGRIGVTRAMACLPDPSVLDPLSVPQLDGPGDWLLRLEGGRG